MLAIQSTGKDSKEQTKVVPNLLPCRINYSGPIEVKERYWKPEATKDGNQVAYFRGRKLLGRSVRIPEGYRGAMLKFTEEVLPTSKPAADPFDTRLDGNNDEEADAEVDDMEDDEPSPDVKIVREVATFDNFNVWGHEALPDEAEDSFIRGVQEWISFAEAANSSGPASIDETVASKQ